VTQPEDLSHIDEEGRARMVDVGAKSGTERVARARAVISMRPETLKAIQEGSVEKGAVFSVARTAGIMAAKRTPELIPLCHPLALTSVQVDFETDSDTEVVVLAEARACDRTGVEMEALTACAVAALTVYDMCKAVDRGMTIQELRVTHKSGGKSGTWEG